VVKTDGLTDNPALIKPNYMKAILWTLGVVTLVGVTVYLFPNKTIVEVPETQVVEKEVEVDALEESINDAQDAKKAEIQSIADKAWQEAYDQEMKKVELEVIKSFNEKLNTRQIELEKETKTY
jgi:transcriptional/translational regulatory protein YebC/TACO1